MKMFSKNILAIVFILFAIAIGFSMIAELPHGQKSQAVSLSELATHINEGHIVRLVIEGNTITATKDDKSIVKTTKESEAGITATLTNYGVSSEALRAINIEIKEPTGFQVWMGILVPMLLPVLLILAIFWFMFRQAKGGVNQAFSFGRANIKMFQPFKDKVTFKDVAGLKEAKQELLEVVDFLKSPKKYLDMGARIPRGVLMLGSPGTGKTLLARAVAGESGVPFFHMSGSEFVEMFVGVGSSRVRDLFETAKKTAPCIIFIDEIDAIGRERGAGLGGGHDEREQTLNQILVEMDGFERDTNVIVIAATNRPDVLDAALLRPGRFDRRVMLDLPDINDREAILKIHAKGKPLDKGVDLKTVAVRTPGFSGADLANLLNEAAIFTARETRKFITQDDILNSIEKVILGPARKSRAISKKEKEITAYHEAGHALVAANMKHADPVHKISIISRGMAGGYTLKLPSEDRHLKTKSQFMAELAVAFGGYAAESLIYKDISTGSSNDIRQATDIARRAITHFGMSEKLGPRTFGKSHEMIFLGREITAEKDYSEKIGEMIDDEVDKLIAKALLAAKKTLTTHRDALEAIAKALIEKETLEQDEFYNIIKSFNLKPIAI